MSWFRRQGTPPELERVEAARSAVHRHGEPRPVVTHTLDKIEEAIRIALADRGRVNELAADFDAEQAAADLKAALRTKARPTDPDSERILALRRRHEAVHALHNRAAEIEERIERTLADLDTFVAERAMAMATSNEPFADVDRWIDTLNADAAGLAATHDAVDDLPGA